MSFSESVETWRQVDGAFAHLYDNAEPYQRLMLRWHMIGSHQPIKPKEHANEHYSRSTSPTSDSGRASDSTFVTGCPVLTPKRKEPLGSLNVQSGEFCCYEIEFQRTLAYEGRASEHEPRERSF